MATVTRMLIGGLFRCCGDFVPPEDAPIGTTIPCKHCSSDGVVLVMHDDGEPVWQAAWITKGHGWRKTTADGGGV